MFKKAHKMKLFTINEVAQILRVHRNTVMKLIYDGDLKHSKVGGQYRISEDQINDYLKENEGNSNAKDEL
jgi:excisionase family DNA binding protein